MYCTHACQFVDTYQAYVCFTAKHAVSRLSSRFSWPWRSVLWFWSTPKTGRWWVVMPETAHYAHWNNQDVQQYHVRLWAGGHKTCRVLLLLEVSDIIATGWNRSVLFVVVVVVYRVDIRRVFSLFVIISSVSPSCCPVLLSDDRRGERMENEWIDRLCFLSIVSRRLCGESGVSPVHSQNTEEKKRKKREGWLISFFF